VPIPRFLARELAAVTAATHPDDLVFTTRGGHAFETVELAARCVPASLHEGQGQRPVPSGFTLGGMPPRP
jgi:hypothetical protein